MEKMTNGEKAKEIATINHDEYVDKKDSLHSLAICEKSALEMAEWKDQQFKEYLEKQRNEYLSQRDDARMWSEQWAVFHALTCTMHQIINELFKEE